MEKRITATILLSLFALSVSAFDEESCDRFPETFSVSESLEIFDVEKHSLAKISSSGLGRVPQVPFGFLNEQWEKFKESFDDGDKLVFFRSADETWESLSGSEGYAILSSGCVKRMIFTTIS